MTPFSKLTVGEIGMTLSEANQIIWDHKLNTLPIIDKDQNLAYFVFRKDYDSHKDNPNELLNTTDKKLLVGAGINSRVNKERVPALVEAGVDVYVSIHLTVSPNGKKKHYNGLNKNTTAKYSLVPETW